MHLLGRLSKCSELFRGLHSFLNRSQAAIESKLPLIRRRLKGEDGNDDRPHDVDAIV